MPIKTRGQGICPVSPVPPSTGSADPSDSLSRPSLRREFIEVGCRVSALSRPRPGDQQALRITARCSVAHRFGVSSAKSGVGSRARRSRRQRMRVGVTSAR